MKLSDIFKFLKKHKIWFLAIILPLVLVINGTATRYRALDLLEVKEWSISFSDDFDLPEGKYEIVYFTHPRFETLNTGTLGHPETIKVQVVDAVFRTPGYGDRALLSLRLRGDRKIKPGDELEVRKTRWGHPKIFSLNQMPTQQD